LKRKRSPDANTSNSNKLLKTSNKKRESSNSLKLSNIPSSSKPGSSKTLYLNRSPISLIPNTSVQIKPSRFRQRFFKPYSKDTYIKYNVVSDDSFIVSIKNYLDIIGINSSSNIGNIKDFKKLHTLSRTISEEDKTKICEYYSFCMNIWDFEKNMWYQYGDVIDCKLSILLYKEDDQYGYLILKEDIESTS
jgi:hypothetical protein